MKFRTILAASMLKTLPPFQCRCVLYVDPRIRFVQDLFGYPYHICIAYCLCTLDGVVFSCQNWCRSVCELEVIGAAVATVHDGLRFSCSVSPISSCGAQPPRKPEYFLVILCDLDAVFSM
ncbi:hypothetical protein CSKR_203038 [Clonorchis sinensis]|uniref:Uncharacterized protein n=1 Tax=Clonorchis sinensis TaxID=79923 RepID=A0A8T1M6V7_CLOSI|nr:hypothetical protein CSKR_203038 [Clonorchis sinensis]